MYFVGIIKLKTLIWGDYPGLLDTPKITTKVFIRGRQEGKNERRKCDNGTRDWSNTGLWGMQVASKSQKR
jgi:hypothetical protein